MRRHLAPSPLTTEIYGKEFYLAHGDGLGDPDNKFKLLRKVFHNRLCQRMLNFVHPWWGMQLGLNWAKHSRMKRADGKEAPYMGEDKEYLVLWTKEYMRQHPNIDYFIYGHRHIELDLTLDRQARMLILGDWIWQFTYVVFDGQHLFLEQYVEGESKP
jgi:UDP-2,3-diacylglucosamine hydrolase